jgi:hypothetical protein
MARLLSVKAEATEEDRDFVLGQFGEKFTIEGLPDDSSATVIRSAARCSKSLNFGLPAWPY